MKPDLKEEKKLWKKGFRLVAGLDEVGRGPLAGPVVAAAVIIRNAKYGIRNAKIRDSKKLTPKQREKFYKMFIAHPEVEWGIGKVSEKMIDKINIFEATKLAMQKAVENLNCEPDYLVLDGTIKINSALPQKAIIKADEKVFSVALASIIAKVTRDCLMVRLDKKYPQYGFHQNKGYGTVRHRQMLKKHGPCKIHRQSFRPVKGTLERF
jgi:ribonuclease HII